MDFQLSDDQRAIAEMAGSLFGDLCSDDRLRAPTSPASAPDGRPVAKCVETGLHAWPSEGSGRQRARHDELMLVSEAQGAASGHVPPRHRARRRRHQPRSSGRHRRGAAEPGAGRSRWQHRRVALEACPDGEPAPSRPRCRPRCRA